MIDIPISRKLLPVLSCGKRFVVIVGGRGSGKSQGIANILLAHMIRGTSVACFREFQNSLSESVISLLREEAERLGLDGFTEANSQLSHSSGSKAIFRGLARNISSIKSLHGYRLSWVEEAQTISKESLKILTPTFREKGAQMIFTANPMSSEDAFSQRFIEPFISDIRSKGFYEDGLHLIIKCNYSDNPWFPDSLEQERLWDKENLSDALYDHIWNGEYNDSIEHSIIESDWFDACVDAHKKLGFEAAGQIKAIHDPADSSDARAYALRHGNIIKDLREEKVLDVNDACTWSCELAREAGADVYIWDAGGLGLSLRRQVNDFFDKSRVVTSEFNGGSGVQDPDDEYSKHEHSKKSVTNKEAFYNLRSQMYMSLRDKCYKTYQAVTQGKYTNPNDLISFSSDIELIPQLRAELCRIPRVYNASGTLQVMRKDMMKQKLKIKSPNLADVVMMSEYIVQSVNRTKRSKNRRVKINVA